jgi:hypothetical protein
MSTHFPESQASFTHRPWIRMSAWSEGSAPCCDMRHYTVLPSHSNRQLNTIELWSSCRWKLRDHTNSYKYTQTTSNNFQIPQYMMAYSSIQSSDCWGPKSWHKSVNAECSGQPNIWPTTTCKGPRATTVPTTAFFFPAQVYSYRTMMLYIYILCNYIYIRNY